MIRLAPEPLILPKGQRLKFPCKDLVAAWYPDLVPGVLPAKINRLTMYNPRSLSSKNNSSLNTGSKIFRLRRSLLMLASIRFRADGLVGYSTTGF